MHINQLTPSVYANFVFRWPVEINGGVYACLEQKTQQQAAPTPMLGAKSPVAREKAGFIYLLRLSLFSIGM